MTLIQKSYDREKTSLYQFLKEEGLSLGEKEILLNKMEEIYQDIQDNNHKYSIFDISRILTKLFDDQFYNIDFVINLLGELAKIQVKWDCCLGIVS